jgi:hypothetical protein
VVFKMDSSLFVLSSLPPRQHHAVTPLTAPRRFAIVQGDCVKDVIIFRVPGSNIVVKFFLRYALLVILPGLTFSVY